LNLSSTLVAVATAYGGCLAVAWVVFRRRSIENAMFALCMAILAIETVCASISFGAPTPDRALRWQHYRLACAAMVPGLWLAFSLCYSRGNYREFLSQWRLPIAAAFAVPMLLAAGFGQGLLTGVSNLEPGTSWFIGLALPGKALHALILIGSVLILMNLERTFRTAVGIMRWRIKLFMLGLGVLFGARLYTSSQAILFSGMHPSLATLQAGALLIACLLMTVSALRSGLAEIDVYPSHALIYRSLTMLVAGVYLLVVGVLAKVASALGGDIGFALKALYILLALVGLTLLLLSDRIRQRTQLFVSRHLRRPLYDYRKVWAAFTERTTSCVERTELCQAVAGLIAETFNVLSVTVWLMDPNRQKLVFGASTSLTEGKAAELLDIGDDFAALTAALCDHPQPIDIDRSKAPWLETLKRCNPDYFHKGGNRVCIPLVAAGQVQGLITLADRVSGVRFLLEDYDLLKCIGDQVAASLLNLQLSRKLLEANELETFQAMSAFFIHDLKNTASTLSLMLQNLPVHFNNPAFREDALRGIGKAAAHINELIGRLTLLRHGLRIQSVETDLNQLVQASLVHLNGAAGIEVITDLEPVPRLRLDPDQMGKVFENLLLNAREAVGAGGQIRIGTSRGDGWAVVTVADNGCGMSTQFMSQNLFRPFQTTKKKGLGIGMFQSKKIVEAHCGRIEVESKQGQGTVFRVRLPLGSVEI